MTNRMTPNFTFESRIFLSVFNRNIQGEFKAEKILQYLRYELKYDILNLDEFISQKRGTPL